MPLTQAPTRLAEVTPVYNDWESFRHLLTELDTVAGAHGGARVDVIAVDDGSTADFEPGCFRGLALQSLGSVSVLHLACNLGHQRAIAIGLSEVDGLARYDAAIVMDCDGEDRPQDIARLLDAAERHPGQIVVAQRARRSEGKVFRGFYVLYKALFQLLTGKRISFGNFSVIPGERVARLVCTPEIWNNLAAAIARSRIPICHCPTDRGVRYAGASSMNLVGLIIHGLSAVSVYSDIAFTRALAFSAGLALLTVAGIASVFAIRLFTDLAIPGWASYMVGFLVVVLMQSLMMSAGAVFLLLNNRSMPSIIPRKMLPEYVRDRTTLLER